MQLLIVEDDAGIRDVLAEVLADAGLDSYAVGRIADAHAALEAGDYDLVLLDLALPDGDGADVLRHIRRQGLDVPVLICSGLPVADRIVALLDTGADGIMEKPFSNRELVARVRAMLRRTVSPAALEAIG